MGLGDVIADSMSTMIGELRGYSHANNKKNKVIILELLANMNHTIGVLDWGVDYVATMDDCRKVVKELWDDWDEDDH